MKKLIVLLRPQAVGQHKKNAQLTHSLLTAILVSTLLFSPTVGRGQATKDTIETLADIIKQTDYFQLYDYSKMGDTVITHVGSFWFDGVFHPGKSLAFAKREITVRGGRLKKVFIQDTNTGRTVTRIYDNKGLKKVIEGQCIVTNAPHF